MFISSLLKSNYSFLILIIIFKKMKKQASEVSPPLPFQRKKLDILVVSDTHGSYKRLKPVQSMTGDIFIHAGDFTYYGQEKDFLAFFTFLQSLKFRYKIVISGNHEINLDNGCISSKSKENYLKHHPCSMNRDRLIFELKKRCIYLQHEMVEIEGVKIFASPYTPYFVGNAFQYRLNHEKIIWNTIPENIDLLVTHCPPYGILDQNEEKKNSGSEYLKQIVFKRKPKYHVFGHIHESVGMRKFQGITFLNVANEPTRILI